MQNNLLVLDWGGAYRSNALHIKFKPQVNEKDQLLKDYRPGSSVGRAAD